MRDRPATGHVSQAPAWGTGGGERFRHTAVATRRVIDLSSAEVAEAAAPRVAAEAPAPVTERPAVPLDALGTLYVRLGKRLLDVVGAAVLLVVLLPLLAVTAIVVRATLGSPVLFRQRRVGLQGRPFEILKFRTMGPDRRRRHEPFEGPDRRRTHKHPGDPRVTRVGRFLRTWSLDELPQLVHVLRGEMSLVGPRPELESIVGGYAPWQHRRHLVKPGLTGLWQVSNRGDAPMHERTDIDIDYLARVTLATDLRILARTVPAALGYRRGF